MKTIDISPSPKQRKVNILFGIVVALLVFIIIGYSCLGLMIEKGLLGSGMVMGMCGNEILQEIYSPDEQHKAVVFERDCGATTAFSTQISILEAIHELPNETGNIFVMDGHPDATRVRVIWENNWAIHFTYASGYKVSYHQETYEDSIQVFQIKYKVSSNK